MIVLCFTASLAAQDMPAADQVVQMRCTVCHAIDLVEQQRLTRQGWEREIAKMRGWGAAVDESQAQTIATYLARKYGPPGPRRPTVSSETSAAADLLNTRCTVCHRTDLIEAQRLDADGWRRELTKMVVWGAQLTPDEIELAVAHLTR